MGNKMYLVKPSVLEIINQFHFRVGDGNSLVYFCDQCENRHFSDETNADGEVTGENIVNFAETIQASNWFRVVYDRYEKINKEAKPEPHLLCPDCLATSEKIEQSLIDVWIAEETDVPSEIELYRMDVAELEKVCESWDIAVFSDEFKTLNEQRVAILSEIKRGRFSKVVEPIKNL